METALVRIRKDQHDKLTDAKSDTGGDVSIGSLVQEAVDFQFKRRQLNALVMKAYRRNDITEMRLVLEEVADFISLPRDYLLED